MGIVSKAKAQSTALSVARAELMRTKQAGPFGSAGGAVGMFDGYRNQAANRRRYALFRGWVYSAVHALATEGAGQPAEIGRLKNTGNPGGKKHATSEMEIMGDHPLTEAIEQPNELQGQYEFVYTAIANMCLTGISYVVTDIDKKRRATSVFTVCLQPGFARSTKRGPFAEFKVVDPRNPAEAENNDVPPLTRDQVSFARFPDPSDPLGALAPAAAQMSAVSIDDKIQASQEVFFDNGIFPSVIVYRRQQPVPRGRGRARATQADGTPAPASLWCY